MQNDLHIHTNHSCDSKTTIDKYCIEAIRKGSKYICFTDHVDFNKNDHGYAFYKPDDYFEDLDRARDKYKCELTVLSGIEFSEPHIYKQQFDDIKRYPYDFILGAVHYWIGDLFVSQMEKSGISAENCYEMYWEELYKAVSYGGFDCLAHMDFPKRYYKRLILDAKTMREIFGAMLKNNISMEINTSSLRKGCDETLPGPDLIGEYKNAGGINITLGSDAHNADELCSGFDKAITLVTHPLKVGYYKNRKFIICDME